MKRSPAADVEPPEPCERALDGPEPAWPKTPREAERSLPGCAERDCKLAGRNASAPARREDVKGGTAEI